MSADIRKYSQQLRRLAEEYYHRQMTTDDYRSQRKRVLDQLEAELAGNADGREARRAAAPEPPAGPR